MLIGSSMKTTTITRTAVAGVVLGILSIAGLAFAATVTVGNPAINGTATDTYSNFTIVDSNHPVSANGTLSTFSYYAANTNPFEFVIVDSSNVVKWISPKITPSAIGVNTWSSLSPVAVQAGWNLGAHFDSTGTVPLNWGGAPATYTPNGNGMPTVGSALTVEGMSNRTYSWNATGSTPASATVVVTPTNTQGWSTADTRVGGAVNFIADATTPSGIGALQLTTDATTAAKAQYLHAASIPIGSVTDLSYYTKQNSAAFAGGDASYQLPTFLNGTTGFTTFVYEPYENGTVVPGAWQYWDVAQGHFWSSKSVTCSNGSVVAGGGGAPFYTLAQIQTMCPNAVVIGFGVNIGSNNPSYNVETDLVRFNATAYDFEPYIVATSKSQCKKDGWKTVRDNMGNSFKNQGDCVRFVKADDHQDKDSNKGESKDSNKNESGDN